MSEAEQICHKIGILVSNISLIILGEWVTSVYK